MNWCGCTEKGPRPGSSHFGVLSSGVRCVNIYQLHVYISIPLLPGRLTLAERGGVTVFPSSISSELWVWVSYDPSQFFFRTIKNSPAASKTFGRQLTLTGALSKTCSHEEWQIWCNPQRIFSTESFFSFSFSGPVFDKANIFQTGLWINYTWTKKMLSNGTKKRFWKSAPWMFWQPWWSQTRHWKELSFVTQLLPFNYLLAAVLQTQVPF